MKTGIIDVGGGMRAVYGAGIYDYLMDNDLYPIDLGIGVSAGAADLATYFARQRGRVLRYFTVYPKRRQYMGLWPFLTRGTFMNLKYIYEDLSLPGCEDPFDAETFLRSSSDMVFVATNAHTGKPEYLEKRSIKIGNLTVLEATAALPVACKPIEFNGKLYYDGGISDPIPYEKAFSMGADKVIVILTKPRDFVRDYNSQIRGMERYEKEGKLLVIAPDDTCGVTTLKHRDDDIMKLYGKGYKDAVGRAV